MNKNYILLKEQYLESIHAKATLLKHIKSGARVVLLSNDDDNKTFTIGFRTPPVDDTGVPHILEHSTLCGSKKFPVKDPFVELLKSSLNTFLNAMTFGDKTIYPVASCNQKDFNNLMEVYMDAVFYPNVYIHEEIFKQEGWHYELENKDSDIIYNGVVYNEMKGAFSSPVRSAFRYAYASLFPDTTYGVESGGDPEFIPDLTYEKFKEFHTKYYSPANSYIVLYGNMDTDERLDWMDKEYLSKFDVIETNSNIPYQKPFDAPITKEYIYPVGKEDDVNEKYYYVFNAVIGDALDNKLKCSFDVLTYALLVAPGAPLKQAILDAKLGKDVLSSYDSGMLQPTLNFCATEAGPGKMDEFKEVVYGSIKDLIKNGINKKLLLSAISYFNFKIRESDFGGFPKGLVYTQNLLETWLYDEDKPFVRFSDLEVLEELKALVETDYFEKLLEKYLLNNNHASFVAIVPSTTLAEEKEKELKEKLAKYKESLSDEQLEKLIADTKALKEYQATPSSKEDLAKIPLLKRSDIDPKHKPIYNKEINVGDIKVVQHEIQTNGIGYVDLYFDTLFIDQNLIPYISLLSQALGKVDTVNYKYKDLFNEIQINTGGISARVQPFTVGDHELKSYLIISVAYIYNNKAKAFELVKEIINNSIFNDEKRILELIQEEKSGMQMMCMKSGHNVAANRALSYISAPFYYRDNISGVGYLDFLKDAEKNFSTKAKEITETLKKIAEYIFSKNNFIVSYTSIDDSIDNEIIDLNKSLYSGNVEKCEFKFVPNVLNEGLCTSAQVQYVARVGIFNKEKYTGAIEPFAVSLAYDYLWNKVRVLGGAYGCMGLITNTGIARYVSYRDPKLAETNDVFENIPNFIDELNPSETELTKFVIAAIGEADAPTSPRSMGSIHMSYYIAGITFDELQEKRNQTINATVEDFKALKPLYKEVLSQNVICVVGNENKIKENEKLFKNIRQLL